MGFYLMRFISVALILFIAISACDKKEKTNDWGPEVPIDDIRKAQSDALALLNPQNIQKGEFAYFIKTQELFSTQLPSSLLIEEEAITVTERDDFDDYFSITTVREVVDHLSDGSPHSKFKDVYYIAKDTAPEEEPVPEEPSDEPIPEDTSVKISFHNLRVERVAIPRPRKVEEREPCAVPHTCDLDSTRIIYDIVIQEPGKEAQRNQAELVLSAKVPFFAGILKSCITTVAAVEDSRPFVKQCKSIYDYLWTSASEDVP